VPEKKRRKQPTKAHGAQHTRNRVYGRPFQKVRPQVLARDGYMCQVKSPVCTVKATCVDHIQDWKLGGAWYDPANLRASCKPCNAYRAAKRKDDTPSSSGRQWPSAVEFDGYTGGCSSRDGEHGPHDLRPWGGPAQCWGAAGHASRDW
jgi:5-methylcytosine-specific restriction endonuclease McrA